MGEETEVNKIFAAFKKLRTDPNFKITSKKTQKYNCIAWAMGFNDRWVSYIYDPTFWWPENAESRGNKPSDLKAAFSALGFTECPSGDIESGYDKVVLYQKDGIWTHAARVISDNVCHSKLGESYDVHHSDGNIFEGSCYGDVFCYMKRRHKSLLSNWFPGRKRDD